MTKAASPRGPVRRIAVVCDVALVILLALSNCWTHLLTREACDRTTRADLERTQLRARVAEAQAARLTRLETKLEKDLSDLRVAYRDTRKALKEKELVVAQFLDASGDSGVGHAFIAGPPVPAIDAVVSAVKDDVSPALVLLSAGSDDKVEKGFHFSVYRGSSFVGKVIVEKVLRDACGCRVLFTKEGESVRPGDSAATRLQ